MKIEEPIWVDKVKSSNFDLKDLPDSIEKEIYDYLSIEYAPDFEATLKYVGEFELWGKPIRCWDFGQSTVYASVQPYADGYFIGVTHKSVADE